MFLWSIISLAWLILAREYNTGRKNLTALEAFTFFAVLGFVTFTAAGRLAL